MGAQPVPACAVAVDPAALRVELARRGFLDTERASRFLSQVAGEDPAALVEQLAGTADPDAALLALVRLAPETARPKDPARGERLLRILGASTWAADQLAADPSLTRALVPPALGEPFEVTYERMAGVVVGHDADTAAGLARGTAALRRAYRRELLTVLSADLELSEVEGAPAVMEPVAAAISNLVGATVNAAFELALCHHSDAAAFPFSIIAMGKTGAEELNYISDVDVIYVCDGEEASAIAATTPLAQTVQRIVSGTLSGEPPLWPLDVNLRPEGKDGPLVRTLDSYLAYYKRWAKTWEFQALLKARPVAGDLALGRRYLEATAPLVWAAVERPNFVEDSQAMRRRVESHVKGNGDRALKLGRGGLRDIEFTVQLLQMVHGRTDPSLHVRGTLPALAALAAGGYAGRDDAAELRAQYTFQRALEHRIQFHRMRRSHTVPSRDEDLRRLGRLLAVDSVDAAWSASRRRVRELHEAIFYRPLLPLTARLTAQELTLEPAAATDRLKAIGYIDPAGAMRNLAALTEGVSRRSAIQRQLLPVMIGWFAAGPDPDAGLLAFRDLSEHLGSTHWYLKLLRDSGVAAERLSYILASSRYAADSLQRLPEAVQWLADDAELAPRAPAVLTAEALATIGRHTTDENRVTSARYILRRELTRSALDDILVHIDPARAGAITDAADVAVTAALEIARIRVRAHLGYADAHPDPARFAVIAMGRMGGREMAYASDADLMYVFEPDGEEQRAIEFSSQLAAALRAVLTEPNPEPALAVDTQLRPEGRRGPEVRSIDSYRGYFERWAEPWEFQALLRARGVAGDAGLIADFHELIEPLRYPADGLDAASLTALRRMKARVESERMPRGVAPTRHLKLGRGGLADVEFTAQLLQLRFAGRHESLRTTSTPGAIEAAAGAGLLSREQADELVAAWSLASRARDAVMLVTGRATKSDVLPKPGRELAVISRVLGYAAGTSLDFEEDYLRSARRARKVVEAVFFG